ncbi:hypothetical protein [Methanococcoides burtonii]|uniref:Uncharacterized protein n=1 Tax=Methanococcoides burtonii (strain DSM 6242 / NBRC 107633 / OCM 468 / ACE-M) TaxID=259564 RepID=Q12YH6_METBU|nr:hypothetical protein [Methanococcoides burtonii]ABE51500.1 Hypothetical protein Mbur_0518 [Methanococcoides burtonii DSM 6242]
MEKSELVLYAIESDIIKKWHWFKYHFEFYSENREHPFAKSIIDSCLVCEDFIPGYAKKFIDDISQISGIDKKTNEKQSLKHYQQLFQRLAELLIIKQVVTYEWPENTKFFYEPTSGKSKKNPELVVELNKFKIGIEVKAPSLLDHIQKRNNNKIQATARNGLTDKFKENEEVTLPRDNPVKDFLISADQKYNSFKENEKCFYGILVIVWDDFIYEPITTLTDKFSGLFTQNSFAKNSNDETLKFENVDSVIIVRHLHQFGNAAGECPLINNCMDAMDFGSEGRSLPNVYVKNPASNGVPEGILECLRAYSPDEKMGAEYMPQDMVIWL